MTKCVYCQCTAAIEPGKGYCSKCGHDAVAHVAAGGSAGVSATLKLVIVAGAILGAFLIWASRPDNAGSVPGSTVLQTPPASAVPADGPPSTATAPPPVYTLPPSTAQPNGQITPAAPPLGDWRSNPGSPNSNQTQPGLAVPDSATPNPNR